jgi:hypothetical protein
MKLKKNIKIIIKILLNYNGAYCQIPPEARRDTYTTGSGK